MDHTEPTAAVQSSPRDDERLAAFVEAICTALTELAGVEATPIPKSLGDDCQRPDDFSVFIELYSVPAGYLVLIFPGSTAVALARSVFAGVQDNVDPNLIRDCLGEIANVTAGLAKSLLAATSHHFSFGLPTTETGPPPATVAGENCVVSATAFMTSFGEFSMQLVDRSAELAGPEDR